MTIDPKEFAEAHGLELDEAVVILARREQQRLVASMGSATDKLQRARAALLATQKRVGVHPVVVSELGVQRSFDQEADENLQEFYKRKAASEEEARPLPTDWEEPP